MPQNFSIQYNVPNFQCSVIEKNWPHPPPNWQKDIMNSVMLLNEFPFFESTYILEAVVNMWATGYRQCLICIWVCRQCHNPTLGSGSQICHVDQYQSWPSYHSVQFSCSVVSDCETPRTSARQAPLCITNSQSPPKPMSIELVMPSNHSILCRHLLLLPSIFPSIRVFSNESVLCIRWPKYWSFSFNISPSNEHPGLISFRMDWLDLLAVQGTLKSLLQHHSWKASILRCSAFFIV